MAIQGYMVNNFYKRIAASLLTMFNMCLWD